MSTVIKVENLCKRYYISHKNRERFPTLRDAITRTASNMGKRLLHPLRASSGQPLEGLDSTEEFWALDDVSFEVKQGGRVGIIGRNGAGKSTLLKILSRITEPTKGRVSIKGRVASLLEVGTGFHPELTGRENIFLNGAILGMSRVDIKRKFDEIVAFSEVEKFLDTPVKRYSSGMYVRLAFSVAAHMEPEVLIVDEVLAVGDAQFQKKCLGKMGEVSKEGRTILFVSHNMAAIQKLCPQAILFETGKIIAVGESEKITRCYMNVNVNEKHSWERSVSKNEKASFLSAGIVDHYGNYTAVVNNNNKKYFIKLGIEVCKDKFNGTFAFEVLNQQGQSIFTSHDYNNKTFLNNKGKYLLHIEMPNFLKVGYYSVNLGSNTVGFGTLEYIQNAFGFECIDETNIGQTQQAPGIIHPSLTWEVKEFSDY